MNTCVNCSVSCEHYKANESFEVCPSRETELIEKARAEYEKEEIKEFARNAALVEKEGYCQLCRVEEIMLFAKKNGYKKLGIAFCVGLKREARMVAKIFEEAGFQVESAVCKNGMLPKSTVGLKDEECLTGKDDEVMCNPIGQAMFLNERKVDLSVILGLCVGHDSLFIKYADMPVTVLAAKDRVTCHNPLAAVYNAESYFRRRFFKDEK